MSQFYDQISQFNSGAFKQSQSHYQTLANGQKPHTFLITCADSRLCPQEMTQTQAGEIFVIRNAGNLIAAYDENNPTNEGLTLEYGICALEIPELIVCGHASCGAMGGLADTGAVKSLPIVHKGLEAYKQAHTSDIEGKTADQLIDWNVDQQLRNIYTFPFIQERIKSGKLKVFGMVYDFVNAQVTYKVELSETGEVLT